MGKNIVYKPNFYSNNNLDSLLKRLAILFEKIYIDSFTVERFTESDRIEFQIPDMLWEVYAGNNALWDYLVANNIVSFYRNEFVGDINKLDPKRRQYIDESIKNISKLKEIGLKIKSVTTFAQLDQLAKQSTELSNYSADLHCRHDAVNLSERYKDDFFPFIKSKSTFAEEADKKGAVVQFLLGNIPEPELNTPWEQIIDFRNDEETRLKYLALINWVNEIYHSSLRISEIKEKYEYLYYDYKKSFEKHKMKSTFGVVEILTTMGMGMLTLDPSILNVVSNFFRIANFRLELLKEEGNLPGKEIAYIYHANKKIANK